MLLESPSRLRARRAPVVIILSTLVSLLMPALVAATTSTPEIMPLSDVKAGMKGVGYTIFSGDKVEPFDLVVLGVLPDLLGPKQSVILVQLVGPKVEHTGVVSGMSGSPVYIDGKLVGALSLKLGQFTKEPIGGVTPIENMLEISSADRRPDSGQSGHAGSPAGANSSIPLQYPLPPENMPSLPGGNWSHQSASFPEGAFLTPIATPLSFTGADPRTVAMYSNVFAGYGMVAAASGKGTPRPDDANIKAGDMVTMSLVSGDITMGASCTVTLVTENRVYACGHPVLSLGEVRMPMSRGRVVTTLSSDMDSVKIMTTGGVIGTFTDDRLTAIAGELGFPPRMVPMDLTLDTPAAHRDFHFQIADNPKLTPLLVGAVAYNGVVSNTAYSEGTTLRLSGDIQIAGHSSVNLDNMFTPTDAFVPDGTFVAVTVQNLFSRIFTNPYEIPHIEKISLKLESLPDRRATSIDGAWTEESEAEPGQTINVKVLLRPYRGEPELREVPVTIPPQADRGTTLRIQVSDAGALNRATRSGISGANSDLGGLEQLIHVLNEERRNNCLYVTLLKPTPTLLVEDKALPNAPLSELNIMEQQRGASNATVLHESVAGEWAVPLNQVVSGAASLTIHVK
jgi:SpoIVB peptidase S55